MFENVLNSIEKKTQKFSPEMTSLAIASGMFSSVMLFINEILDVTNTDYDDIPNFIDYIISGLLALTTLLAVWYQLNKARHINMTNMSNTGRRLHTEILSTKYYAKESSTIAHEFVLSLAPEKQFKNTVENIINIELQNNELKNRLKKFPPHNIKIENVIISGLEAIYTANGVNFVFIIYDKLFKHEDIESGFELRSFIPTVIFFLMIACLDIYKWKRFDQYTKYLPEASILINDINSVRQDLKKNINELVRLASFLNICKINTADLKQLAPLLSSLTILSSKLSNLSRSDFIKFIREEKIEELKNFLDLATANYFNTIKYQVLTHQQSSSNMTQEKIQLVSQASNPTLINESIPLLPESHTHKRTILDRTTHVWYMFSILSINIQAIGYFLQYFALPSKIIMPAEIILGAFGFLLYLSKHNEYQRSIEKFQTDYLKANDLLDELRSSEDVKQEFEKLKLLWKEYQSNHFQTEKIAEALIKSPEIQKLINNNIFWEQLKSQANINQSNEADWCNYFLNLS